MEPETETTTTETATARKRPSKPSTKPAAKKAKSAKKVKTAKAKKAPKLTVNVRPGTKTAMVAELLQRPDGCTTKDVLKATGWPTVSMPQQAKAAGLKLKKEKVDGVNRYSAA